MKKTLRSAWIGTTLVVIGLSACDSPAPPQPAATPAAETQAAPAGDAVVAVMREDLADICRDKDPYSTARRLGALLPTLGPEMVPAVKQTLQNLRLDLRATEVELLVWFWATHQPQEAALWAKKKAPVGYREAAVYSALRVWAEADPSAAIAFAWPWIEEPDYTLQVMVPIALVRGWYAQGDPPELREWISKLPMDIGSQRAVSAYLRVVIEQQGPQVAMSWAESLPDEEDTSFKLTVFRRVVDLLSQLDPQAAVRWCDAHCDGPYGTNMRNLTARKWAYHDAKAALAWLSTANEGYERNLAVRMTWAQWSRMDRDAAVAWAEAHTQEGELPVWIRPIYPVYARVLSEEAPIEALRWGSLIENEKEREHVLINVARVWRRTDEAAVEEWLRQSALSEQAREKVRAPLEKLPPQPPG